MKLLHIHKWNHDFYVDDYIAKNNLQKLKSNELEKFIYNHNFYYGTALTKSFEKLGYQTKNIIEDNYLGNNKWFEENYGKSNISYDEKLLRRIKNFNPNIIFFQDMTTLSEQMIDRIDFELKELKLKIVSIGFPIKNKQLYKKFDLVIFRYPDLYNKNNSLSKESMMLYHSFNNNIYEKLNFKDFKSRNNEINFIGGSYGLNHSSHKKRYFYLRKLSENKKIDLYISENYNKFQLRRFYLCKIYKFLPKKLIFFTIKLLINLKILSEKNKFVKRLRNFDNEIKNNELFYFGPLNKILNQNNKFLYGNDLFNKLIDTKISLNIHTDKLTTNVANNRMFEITGCGSCMFVEDRENLEELFKKDVEVIAYEDIEDLIHKIKFYSNKMDKIEKVAEKGYIKTINNHTTFHRVLKIHNKIEKLLN